MIFLAWWWWEKYPISLDRIWSLQFQNWLVFTLNQLRNARKRSFHRHELVWKQTSKIYKAWSQIDRVPVSVSEWLLGSFVLILYLSNSTNIHKYWDGNAVYIDRDNMKADEHRRRRPALPAPPLLHRARIQVKDHDLRLHGQPHAGPSLLRKCNMIISVQTKTNGKGFRESIKLLSFSGVNFWRTIWLPHQ